MTTSTQQHRFADILLVEDSPSDATLTREALVLTNTTSTLHHVSDGVAALAYLHKEEPYADAPTPDLILLDLNLPKMNGHDVLRSIKQDPVLCTIPVVVLTTSKHDADVLRAYQMHANCYVVKPVDFSQFVNFLQTLESFWFNVVTLPIDREDVPAG